MKFDRVKPCASCPFRTGEGAVRYLGRPRAEEIVNVLRSDGTFTCHDDLEKRPDDRNHCVGAMILLEAEEAPNQMMRFGDWIGLYDRHQLTGQADVFESFDDWIESQARTR